METFAAFCWRTLSASQRRKLVRLTSPADPDARPERDTADLTDGWESIAVAAADLRAIGDELVVHVAPRTWQATPTGAQAAAHGRSTVA